MSTSILLGKIAREDENMIDDLALSREKIEASKKELEEQKALFESQEKKLQGERKRYKAEIEKRNALLGKLRKEKALHEQAARELQQAQQEVGNTIRRLMRQKQELIAKERERNEKPTRVIAYVPDGGRLDWPLRGEVSETFGKRVHTVFKTTTMHTGIDIRAPRGTAVRAAGPEKFSMLGGFEATDDHYYRSWQDLSTVYAHLSSTGVDEGQGGQGASDRPCWKYRVSTGPHLHFEVRVNGDARIR